MGWDKSKNRKKHVKTWQLVLAFFLLGLGSIYALRQNNLNMVKLRSEVIAADERGEGVAESLEKLGDYVFHHMNTRIVRPIELVHTYNRQAKALIESNTQQSGRDVYAEATAACERRGIPLTSIAQCTADYAIQNGGNTQTPQIKLPDKNLFTYSFAAPRWTPDLAGILLVLTGVVGLWIASRAVVFVAVKMVLRRRIRSGF